MRIMQFWTTKETIKTQSFANVEKVEYASLT